MRYWSEKRSTDYWGTSLEMSLRKGLESESEPVVEWIAKRLRRKRYRVYLKKGDQKILESPKRMKDQLIGCREVLNGEIKGLLESKIEFLKGANRILGPN